MTSFAAMVRADARLAILRTLHADPGYSQNHTLLARAVDHATGITMMDRDIRDHLAWLEDRKLVSTEVVGHLVIAKLTRQGGLVAGGMDIVEGVSRPGPQ